MAHVIGVKGIKETTAEFVDQAMDLLRRARKNLREEDGATGGAKYVAEQVIDGVATLDKNNSLGIVARVVAEPTAPLGGAVDLGADVEADIGRVTKSTGDATVRITMRVESWMDEAATTTSREA